jgi:hypothetical protein
MRTLSFSSRRLYPAEQRERGGVGLLIHPQPSGSPVGSLRLHGKLGVTLTASVSRFDLRRGNIRALVSPTTLHKPANICATQQGATARPSGRSHRLR